MAGVSTTGVAESMAKAVEVRPARVRWTRAQGVTRWLQQQARAVVSTVAPQRSGTTSDAPVDPVPAEPDSTLAPAPLTLSSDELTRRLDRLEKQHRSLLNHRLQPLGQALDHLVAQDGPKHPHLRTVTALYHRFARVMEQHLWLQQSELFPAIRQRLQQAMASMPGVGQPMLDLCTASQQQLEEAAMHLARIRVITDGLVAPDDAHPQWQGVFDRMAELERELTCDARQKSRELYPAILRLDRQSQSLTRNTAA